MSKTVLIVGAGFSGLTLAYELEKQGFKVRIQEKQKRAGGLLGTVRTDHGLVETAANALLTNAHIEAMFDDIGVGFAGKYDSAKKRYIYWDRPSRWPLTWRGTRDALWTAARIAMGRDEVYPAKGETVAHWARRTIGEEAEERLLGPGLQGIFASTTDELSAALTLKNMLKPAGPKGRLKGSVAPERGMESLIVKLSAHLAERGIEIEFEKPYTLPEYLTEPVVLATSAWGAADILRERDPKSAATLAKCESIALVTATAFFEPYTDDLDGFGCLFPPSQGFAASGVLFNTSIFEGRGDLRSETWILGGSQKVDLVTWSDDEIRDHIVKDRERLTGRYQLPASLTITRWPRTIPNYTVSWEKALATLKPEPPLFLHGNYLGEIGLARIYRRSQRLARKMKEMYG